MKTGAKIISYLFHPLLFPTLGALIILLTNPTRYGFLGHRVHVVWIVIVFALTFLFPLVWLVMMKRLDMIENLKLENAKERIIPFVATATFYLWATWMFKPNVNMKIPANLLMFYMLLGASFGIFLAFFINIFDKISLHAVGAGSLLGLMLTLTRFSTFDLRPFLVITVLVAGLIGTARLALKSHVPRQIYWGYFVGFTGQFVAFGIVPHFI